MKKILLFLLIFTISFHSIGGNDNFYPGSRIAGMGYAGLTTTDLWGAQHNQANLGYIYKYAFGAFYENRYGLKETGFKSVAGVIPAFKTSAFSVSANQFGYSQYTEAKYGLGYGQRFSEGFSMGMQINYNTIRFGDNYGKKQTVTAEFSVRAKLIDKLTFAGHIYNLSRALIIKNEPKEFIPTIIRTGIEYKFSDVARVVFENESTINFKTNFRLGAEYTLKKKISFRTGINTYPFSAAFGFGYKYKSINLDVAANYHQVLGFSPNLSLHVEFGKTRIAGDPVQ